MNLYIRKAQTHELKEALKMLLEAALWLKGKNIDYWQNWLSPAPEYVAWIEQGFNNNEFYFVENDGNMIVGMFRLQYEDELFWGNMNDRAGYIHSFTTKRSLQGNGLGYSILKLIEKHLADEGIPILRLDCSPHITGLCKYYEDYGFSPQGSVEVYGENLKLYEKKEQQTNFTE